MAPHSSTLAWKIPWMEEPGRLQSMGLLRVGHNWVTSLSLFCIGEGNGNPLQCSCLENPRDRGACWAAVYEVTQSRTRLKRLSSSSNGHFTLWMIACLKVKRTLGSPKTLQIITVPCIVLLLCNLGKLSFLIYKKLIHSTNIHWVPTTCQALF